MTQLCVSDYCNLPGVHEEGCEDDTCRGCGPAVAADGLYLCRLCTKRLHHDAWNAAWRYEALGQSLAGGGGSGDTGFSTGEDEGITLDAAAVEFRTAIRSTMVGICRLIGEERGVQLPDDTVPAMATFIGLHRHWLAAHQAAAEHAHDLRDIALDPTAFRVAFPSRSDRTYLGTCPLPLETEDGSREICGARLFKRSGDELVVCPGCETSQSVWWWQWEMFGPDSSVVDAYAAATHLSARWMREVDPALIRKWGQRYPDAGLVREMVPDPETPGKLKAGRPVRDRMGRALYLLDALVTVASRMWGAEPNPSLYPPGTTFHGAA